MNSELLQKINNFKIDLKDINDALPTSKGFALKLLNEQKDKILTDLSQLQNKYVINMKEAKSKKIIGNALLKYNKKIRKNDSLNKLKQFVNEQRKIKQIRKNLAKINVKVLGRNKVQKIRSNLLKKKYGTLNTQHNYEMVQALKNRVMMFTFN